MPTQLLDSRIVCISPLSNASTASQVLQATDQNRINSVMAVHSNLLPRPIISSEFRITSPTCFRGAWLI
ncbi:Serine palmitoyltransferase 1 [Fusarium oxysporum f. sp. albedinis]|nr:Serine palmitoyltransferase 1 [Fusarium oxysporum f. sp. albedinis]